MLKVISSFASGALIGLSLGSPAEWALHKHILHASLKMRSRFKFVDNAARGHNDNHHGAYKGPEHYYRDITNEHEVIHFSKGDVGLIAGVSTALGYAVNRAYTSLAENSPSQFESEDGAFVLGMTAGVMGYYSFYEFTHHYMHVIGKRRLSINRVLGDIIQGGKEKRDGKLRLSKPLLDDLCNRIEHNIDRKPSEKMGGYENLAQRLGNQLAQNNSLAEKPHLEVNSENAESILHDSCSTMILREQEYRSTLSLKESLLYSLSRKVQKNLRPSPLFSYLDNHHFIHHKYYGSNLNVVLPLMDIIRGTEKESTRECLESNKSLWLCPNSPDVEVFKRKEKGSKRVAKKAERIALSER